jgi:hypothetical protein
VAVRGVGHNAHDSGRLAEDDGVRPAGPGQCETGRDQPIPHGSAGTTPLLLGWVGRPVWRHALSISVWTPYTYSVNVDGVHHGEVNDAREHDS